MHLLFSDRNQQSYFPKLKGVEAYIDIFVLFKVISHIADTNSLNFHLLKIRIIVEVSYNSFFLVRFVHSKFQ